MEAQEQMHVDAGPAGAHSAAALEPHAVPAPAAAASARAQAEHAHAHASDSSAASPKHRTALGDVTNQSQPWRTQVESERCSRRRPPAVESGAHSVCATATTAERRAEPGAPRRPGASSRGHQYATRQQQQQQQQQNSATQLWQQPSLSASLHAAQAVAIDARCRGDPQMCPEYAEDIYSYLLEAECAQAPSPSYMERVQSDVNQQMRGILVDWLVEVAEEYRLHSDTLFLSVLYADKALSSFSVQRSRLQLVGVTAMLIASKLEEIYAPSVEDFCYITDNTYSRAQVIEMEQKILHALQYQLVCPTTKTFLRRFLRASQADQHVDFLASFLAELSLLEYRFLSYRPSTVAASAVFVANFSLGRTPWSQTLTCYASHTPEELREPVIALLQSFRCSTDSSLPAIGEKYSHGRFHNIAATPAPPSIPDVYFTTQAMAQG